MPRFKENYNASLPFDNARELPQSAYDYPELAEDAATRKKKWEFLSKALELVPDNLDPARMVAELNAKKPEDLLAPVDRFGQNVIVFLSACTSHTNHPCSKQNNYL